MGIPINALGGYEVGDLVGYRSITGAVVKARIVRFGGYWSNPRDWAMLLKVTGTSAPHYPRGHLFWVRCRSAFVFLRRRREVV